MLTSPPTAYCFPSGPVTNVNDTPRAKTGRSREVRLFVRPHLTVGPGQLSHDPAFLGRQSARG